MAAAATRVIGLGQRLQHDGVRVRARGRVRVRARLRLEVMVGVGLSRGDN